MSAKLEAKFPKAFEKSAGVRTYLSDIWKETFPNEELNVRRKMEKRRELAKLESKLTAEEIDAIQDEIPEWKRAAVTIVDNQAAVEEKKGFLSRQMGKISNKLGDTKVAKDFKETEEYKELQKQRLEFKDFKENFKEGVSMSHNPLVRSTQEILDKVHVESSVA